MKKKIRNIVDSTPESRQAKNLTRLGRDFELINSTNYGEVNNTLTYSGLIFPPNSGYAAGTVLLDGRVFLNGTGTYVKSIVYNPINNTVIPCIDENPDNKNMGYLSNVLLADGRVLIPPTFTNNGTAAQFRIYDPTTNIISELAGSYASGLFAGAYMLPNNKIVVLPCDSSVAIEFDPVTYQTRDINIPFSAASTGGGATVLYDGRLLTIGLYDNVFYLWDYRTDTTETIALPANVEALFSTCLLPDGNVLMKAQSIIGDFLQLVKYNPDLNSCSVITPPTSNFYDYISIRPDGKVLVLGYDSFCSIYDPILDTFTQSDLFAVSGSYISAVNLQDGRVLLISGFRGDSNGQLIFMGNPQPQQLPQARVCSPYFNKH